MLSEIIDEFVYAKAREDEWRDKRRQLGVVIASALNDTIVEGTKTHTVDNYKVIVKSTVNRRVDWVKFDEAMIGHKHPPVKTRRELDVRGLKWIKENDEELYLRLCDAIESRPGAPQVTVNEVEK